MVNTWFFGCAWFYRNGVKIGNNRWDPHTFSGADACKEDGFLIGF